MKKFMMIAIIMMVGFAFIPNVNASYNPGSFGKVEDATKSDSKISGEGPSITPNNQAEKTTVKYSGYSLELLDEAPGRQKDTAWVAIKVSYPDGVISPEEYQVYINGKEYNGGEKNADNYTEYFGITEENIKKALSNENHLLEYTVGFDWDKNDSIDQTVVIQIDPMTVKLYEDHEMHTPVWTEEMAQEEMKRIEDSKTPVSPSEEPEKTEEQKAEKNADTADINLSLLFSVLAISTLGLGYTFKKRFSEI